MNGILLAPSFSDWLFDLLHTAINMFAEEGEGDKSEEDKGEEDGDGSGEGDPNPMGDGDGDDEGDKDKGEEGAGEGEGETQAHMIPKARYDSAQKRARTAEARVKQYEKEQAEHAVTTAVVATDAAASKLDTQLEEIDRGIEQARLDGDTDKVVQLSKEARDVEKNIYQAMADTAAATAGTQAQERVKLDSLIDALEGQYDILNPDSENFDEDKINEILDMQSAFVKNGETPSSAMLKAVGYIMPEERITDQVAGKRRTNVAKNLEAAKRQAPNSDETGLNSDAAGKTDEATDLSQMTEAEFDALPQETIKRLRGDAV